VGIVFDVGGRGDKSFNDGAYLGAERAQRDLAARVRFIEPGEGSDREAGLRLLAAEALDIVLGIGFIFTDDLTSLAKEYPGVRFAGVDYAIATDATGQPIMPPPNLAALKFREEEGSFLVGALAALMSQERRIGDRAYTPTRRVGFIGGMDIPLIHKFEAGYRAGVKRSAIRGVGRRSRSASTRAASTSSSTRRAPRGSGCSRPRAPRASWPSAWTRTSSPRRRATCSRPW
jgi:basic membrane protein A